jgi:DNA-binding SARP family transcriptional activator
MQNRLSRPKDAAGAMLELHLLGPMQVRVAGDEAELSARKARALLAYLALRPDVAVPRETLIGLLWGDRGEDQARASLRQTLSAIRKALGNEAAASLIASNESVTLTATGVWVDMEALEQGGDASAVDELAAAANLYRGELLEGLSFNEPTFDHWLSAERERARTLVSRVLSRLIELFEGDNRVEDAIAHGARLLALDPLQEHVHRTLMSLYMAQGRHDAALSQFEQCRQALDEQLGVAPAQETMDLAAEIRGRRRQPLTWTVGSSTSVQNVVKSSSDAKLVSVPSLHSSKPSLAVKPFESLSTDPDQDAFADALSNGVMAALIRLPRLILINDETPSFHRSKAMSADEIGRQFDVQYVLKGSLYKAADTIRISVQLIEVATGRAVWADTLDRNLSDPREMLSVQDELTDEIATALGVKLTGGEAFRLVRNTFENKTALQTYYAGEYQFWTSRTDIELREAQYLLEEAIRLEPSAPAPYATAAAAYWTEALSSPENLSPKCLDRAVELAEDAIRLNDVTGYAHMVLAQVHLSRREFDEASEEIDLLVSARPSCPATHSLKASALIYLGHPSEAVEYARYALRLTPVHPPMHSGILANALFDAQRFEEAVQAAEIAIELDDGQFAPYLYLSAAHSMLSNEREARRAANQVLKLRPDFSLEAFTKTQPYMELSQLDALVDALKLAGLD